MMKRKILLGFTSVLLSIVTSFGVACNPKQSHEHIFNIPKVESTFLSKEATCESPAEYYYSCACGEFGTLTFTSGKAKNHEFTVENALEENLKSQATCKEYAVYYKTCKACGAKGSDTDVFVYGEKLPHEFTQEIPDDKFIKEEPTTQSPTVYYKSCTCGEFGEETFTYGEVCPTLSEDQRLTYKPTSLTVSLYDAENSVYGFTFNTVSEPLYPLIQVKKSNEETWQSYKMDYVSESTYNSSNAVITYYISKAEIVLEADVIYTYRAYDRFAMIGTENTTLKTKNTKSTNFTFAHVSDTQDGPNQFSIALKPISKNVDFIVHTGDVVENSKYEYEWQEMLDANYNYLSQTPIMAVSGNHETTISNTGSNETYKHFNYKIPNQESTLKGFFYSFKYGNVKFIMLNTNDLTGNNLKPEQYNWLVSELKNNDCKWTIVAMHNPLYSPGQWGSLESKNQVTLALRSQLQTIFAQYKVDIVLQGHDHVLSRSYPINSLGMVQSEEWITEGGERYSLNPKGVIYLVTGTTGSQNNKPLVSDETTAQLYMYSELSKVPMWTEFEVSEDSILVNVKYCYGTIEKIYNTWGIKKAS